VALQARVDQLQARLDAVETKSATPSGAPVIAKAPGVEVYLLVALIGVLAFVRRRQA
jgi:hypothetical protein